MDIEQLKARFMSSAGKKKVVDVSTVCINEKTPVEKVSPKPIGPDFEVSDRGRLTENNVIECWQRYATSLEATDHAMANRLRHFTPSLLGPGQFIVTVGGSIIGDSLMARKADVEKFFLRHIGVRVIMHVVVMSGEQAQRHVCKAHILECLMTEYPALRTLVDALEMEIV